MTPIHVRWMIRRDLPEVLAIEQQATIDRWDEWTIIQELGKTNCVGNVAEIKVSRSLSTIVGTMIYELERESITVLLLRVHDQYRRMGVGRALMSKLFGKLASHRRKFVNLTCREHNLDAQRFYRAIGMRAIGSVRDFYKLGRGREDAISFQYALPSRSKIEASGPR